MEILNTISGKEIIGISGWLFPTILLCGIGLVLLLVSMLEEVSFVLAAIGAAITVASIIILANVNFDVHTGKHNPTQYEVRITDKNYIIDATKYAYVGKRGDIIILEEVKK